MIAVFLPCSRASIAARSPAPPAPITTTSYRCRSMSVAAADSDSLRADDSLVDSLMPSPVVIVGASVHDPGVGEPSRRHGHHVEVGQRQRAQRGPGQLLVLGVELGDL